MANLEDEISKILNEIDLSPQNVTEKKVEKKEPSTKQERPKPVLNGTSAFIIDDSKHMRDLIKHYLNEYGMIVIGEAEDFDTTMTELGNLKDKGSEDPTLITLDIVMPKVEGDLMIEDIKEICPTSKIIIVSIRGEHKRVIQCINKGVDGYVLKPINKNNLKKTLESIGLM